MKKKLALLIAGTILAGALSGFGASAAEENQVKTDETLTVAFAGEPEGMTRLSQSCNIGLFLNPNYGYLLNYNQETKSIESGAAEYETIDDTHYRFTIKDGVEFSDGTPVTADDVLYTIQCLKEVGMEATLNLDVDNFVIEDEHTIVIALTEYELGWDYWFTDDIPIFSKASIESIGLENTMMEAPVSFGKYTVKEWKHGEYILYERNENYYDDSYTGYYKYLKFTFIPDAASRVLAVRSGDVDVADGIAVSDYVGLTGDPSVGAMGYDSGKVLNLLVNCEKITDVKVREAIAHAVNAENVNAIMNLGNGKVEQGLFPSTFKNFESVFEDGHVSYDAELAKQLLAEAGYEDGLSLKLICLRANQTAAAVVQEDLRQAGIEVEVNSMDQMAYLDTSRSGDYDLQISTNNAIVPSSQNLSQIDPDRIGKAANSIRYDSDELRAILNNCLSSDAAVSEAAFKEAQKYVLGNYCMVGLCSSDNYLAYKKELTNFNIGSRLNRIDFTQVFPQK